MHPVIDGQTRQPSNKSNCGSLPAKSCEETIHGSEGAFGRLTDQAQGHAFVARPVPAERWWSGAQTVTRARVVAAHG